MAKLPILLLAAGESSRMGQPKQLLEWSDKPLIINRIETLQGTGQPIVIVLGANSQLVMPFLENLNVEIVLNLQWSEGMGSSVANGIKFIRNEYPDAEGVMIVLVDQPLITSTHFCRLIDQFQPGAKQIINSVSTNGWEGVPAVFDRSYFEELQQLNSGEGAKSVIRRYPDKVVRMVAEECLEDIDTPEKYQELRKRFESL